MLVPEVVRAAMEEARMDPKISWVYLSTNGLGLTNEWFAYLRAYPKAILTVSMDGAADDHRRQRRPVRTAVTDSYDHLLAIRDELHRTPRVVITQTIAPANASRAAANLEHLMGLGFWRFNFLPGYYVRWRTEQVRQLERAFGSMASLITRRWQRNERTYVRNLFTYAPTPFFNTGLVVDSDGTIHPSNIGLSGALDHTRDLTLVGTLNNPPNQQQLIESAARVNDVLEASLDPRVLASTRTVDALLTKFCRGLYPHWARYRRERGAA